MWQELVITDITRMGGNRVCIAGVNERGENMRPLLPPPGVLEDHLFIKNDALITPKSIIRMQVIERSRSEPPHSEDCEWVKPFQSELQGHLDGEEWRALLQRTTMPSVHNLFGTELLNGNRNIKPGTGLRSIGTIKPMLVWDFKYQVVERDGKSVYDYRLGFRDASGEWFRRVKINDLTLQVYVDHLHRRGWSMEKISETVKERFKRKGQAIWLRLGLTRSWEGWCWLQVTGIYTFPDYLDGACFADFST